MLSMLAVLALVAATSAAAQRPQTREGFWIGLGLGGGSLSADCTGCDIDAATGGSGYLRLGGTVSPTLLIAGETTSWLGTLDDNTAGESIDAVEGYLGAAVYFYPMQEGGLWLRGGLGFAYGVGSGTFDDYTWSAPAIVIGGGYDIRVGEKISIVPGIVFLLSGEGDIEGDASGLLADDFKTTLIALQVGVTFH
jgi:hypothetical protein